jgi:hypothetical protein
MVVPISTSVAYLCSAINFDRYLPLRSLAVRFLFETSDALSEVPTFQFEPFTVKAARNDYEVCPISFPPRTLS